MNTKNLTGQKIEYLTVIERTDQKRGSCYLWRCRCECGNELLVTTYSLTHRLKKSCGCANLKNDLTGRRFGRLTAVRATGKREAKGAIWECLCDCGKTVQSNRWALLSGDTQSCGCLHDEMATERIKRGRKRVIVDGTNVSNISNSTISANNTSGVRGVSWHRRLKKWQAQIAFQGKKHCLGYYDKLEDAAIARRRGEEQYFETFLDGLEKR